MMKVGELWNLFAERRKFKLLAKHVEQEKSLILDPPRRTDAEIGQFGLFVCRIPTLNDLIKTDQAFLSDHRISANPV